MMIELRDKDGGEPLGTINERQLQFLVDQLEEESSEDRDYYINAPTNRDVRGGGRGTGPARGAASGAERPRRNGDSVAPGVTA
ncbi:MAG: hypothetical protein ACREME_09470 [Gemmatimonadales bacterium]